MRYLYTLHGSRLYNLHHSESDYDYYMVSDEGKTRQRIDGDQDAMHASMKDFMMFIQKPAPQALEALYSTMAEPTPLDGFRFGFRPNTAAAFHTYSRTMKSFALHGSFKRRRHALRLALNLNDLLTQGYFNPTLSDAQRDYLSEAAAGTPQSFLADFRRFSLYCDPFDMSDAELLATLADTWEQ